MAVIQPSELDLKTLPTLNEVARATARFANSGEVPPKCSNGSVLSEEGG